MKALSGYAEWFWVMAMNIKPVENRPWPLFRYIKLVDLPARVYLHASKTAASIEEVEFIRSNLTNEQRLQFDAVDWKALRGVLFATITVTGQVTKNVPDPLFAVPAFKSWFFGPNGFCVEDGKFLDKPIPYRGELGFFEVHLPARVVGA